MEYNKKLFTKANDKKVLHKVKKQWVVLSMALLAAFGAKALATHAVNADVTTPAAGKTTSQASSSKPASDTHLVNSQSNVNVNNQNNNRSQANQISQGRQNTHVNVKSSNQIMRTATQIHQHMLNNATHNLGSIKPTTLGAQPQTKTGDTNQSNSNEQGGQAMTAKAVKKPNLTSSNDDQQNQGIIPVEIYNSELKTPVTNVDFHGKPNTEYSVSDVWNQIKVPGYHLLSDMYPQSGRKMPSSNYTIPANGKAPLETLYVVGDHVKGTIPVNLVLRVFNSSNGASGLKTFNIPYQIDGDMGSLSIQPNDLLTNPAYAKYFTDSSDGHNYSQKDYDTTQSDYPVNIKEGTNHQPIPVQSNGQPYPDGNMITLSYIRKGVVNKNATGLPLIYVRYFDRDKYDDYETPNQNVNNQALHSIVSDMYNPIFTTSKFDYQFHRDNPPAGYYYVSDINGHIDKATGKYIYSDPTPTKFGPQNSRLFYNVKIAKDAQLIYQEINSDGKGGLKATQIDALPLRGFTSNDDNKTIRTDLNDKDLHGNQFSNFPSNEVNIAIPQGYHVDPNEPQGQAYTKSDAYTSNGQQRKKWLTTTVQEGQKYYVNLYPDTEYLNIDYVDANWPSTPSDLGHIVAKNKHNPFSGSYMSNLNDGAPYPNAKYISDNIPPINGKKWRIPSDKVYYNSRDPKDPRNGKLLNQVFSNTVYSFNSTNPNNTVTVPVEIPGDYTTRIIYEDPNNHQVGNPIFVTGGLRTPVYSDYYVPAKEHLPQGYQSDTSRNDNSNDPTIPEPGDTLRVDHGNTEHIYVTPTKGTINVNYYFDNGNGYTLINRNHPYQTISDTGHSFNQSDSIKSDKAKLPNPYKNYPIEKITTGNKNNEPVTKYIGKTTQNINVYLMDALQGTVYYRDVSGLDENSINDINKGRLISDGNGKPITKLTQLVKKPTLISDKPYTSTVPTGYHLDTDDPTYPIDHSAWQLNDNNKKFYVNVLPNQGTITITYYVNGHQVDFLNDQNKANGGSFRTTRSDTRSFDQNHAISDHMTPGYRNDLKQGYREDITTSNNNAPITRYGDNTTQWIKVNLTKNVSGKVVYVDVNNQSDPVGQKTVPSDPIGTPVNINNYNKPSDIPSGYALSSDNPTNPNWKLDSDGSKNDYSIKVDELGNINVHYITDMNKSHILTPYDQHVQGKVGHGFDWSKYTDTIPEGYTYVTVLPNHVNSFAKTPQDVYIDVDKPSNPTPQPSQPSDSQVTIQYKDINNGNIITSWNLTGPKNKGISDATYYSRIPYSQGYQFDHYDSHNKNSYDGGVDIVWVKKPSTPTPQPSYAPAPSSAPSAPASSASPAPSQSSAAPSSSVTPPSSKSVAPQRKSVAPQRKSTRPAYQTKRGKIGVTYEEPNGQVITQRNYSGKIGKSFAPTAPSGYHYVVVKGKNVKQFKDHRQHVIMKLVKSDYYGISHKGISHKATASSANRRNGRTDQDLKMYSGSNRASFDHALDQEANIARNRANGKKLPQTGESQSNYVEVIGAALLMISAVFVAGYDFDMKRRRD